MPWMMNIIAQNLTCDSSPLGTHINTVEKTEDKNMLQVLNFHLYFTLFFCKTQQQFLIYILERHKMTFQFKWESKL